MSPGGAESGKAICASAVAAKPTDRMDNKMTFDVLSVRLEIALANSDWIFLIKI